MSLKERVHKTVTEIPNKTNSNEKLRSNSTNKKYGKMKESSIIRESSQVKELANRGNKDPKITQVQLCDQNCFYKFVIIIFMWIYCLLKSININYIIIVFTSDTNKVSKWGKKGA